MLYELLFEADAVEELEPELTGEADTVVQVASQLQGAMDTPILSSSSLGLDVWCFCLFKDVMGS